jgi:hypothetical protein
MTRTERVDLQSSMIRIEGHRGRLRLLRAPPASAEASARRMYH